VEPFLFSVPFLLWDQSPEKLGFWGGLVLVSFFLAWWFHRYGITADLHPVSIFGAVIGLGGRAAIYTAGKQP